MIGDYEEAGYCIESENRRICSIEGHKTWQECLWKYVISWEYGNLGDVRIRKVLKLDSVTSYCKGDPEA